MKIVIDARFYGTENTGLGRYTTNYLRALAKLNSPHTYYLLLKPPYVRSLSLPKNFHKISCNIPHYSLAEQIFLPRLISSLQPDLYHALHINVPLFIPIPFIVTLHDLIKSHFHGKETSTRPGILFFLKRWGYQLVISHAARNSRAIICPSQYVKHDILSHFPFLNPRKIFPIYEAVDPVIKKLSKPPLKPVSHHLNLPAKYLLYVGNAYPHKNLQLLLNAFSSCSADPSLFLVIVSQQNSFLHQLLAAFSPSLRKRIRLYENLDDPDLVTLYQHALATVIPSLMEGFGLVGLESLASGTPILVSDIPVFHEIYGEAAHYFDPKNLRSLSRALTSSRTLRQPSPLPLPRQYSWKLLAQQIHELYENRSRL